MLVCIFFLLLVRLKLDQTATWIPLKIACVKSWRIRKWKRYFSIWRHKLRENRIFYVIIYNVRWRLFFFREKEYYYYMLVWTFIYVRKRPHFHYILFTVSYYTLSCIVPYTNFANIVVCLHTHYFPWVVEPIFSGVKHCIQWESKVTTSS